MSASEATLKEALASLLENPAELGRLGRLGRSYVERYHDYRKIAVVLARLLRNRQGPWRPACRLRRSGSPISFVLPFLISFFLPLRRERHFCFWYAACCGLSAGRIS